MKHASTNAVKREFASVRKAVISNMAPEAVRCAYCRALLQPGEARAIGDGEQTVYVHRRHPKRAGEQAPKETA